MAKYKITVKKANDQHEIIIEYKEKNTTKGAYEYGQALGLEVFGMSGVDIHVEVEEQLPVV